MAGRRLAIGIGLGLVAALLGCGQEDPGTSDMAGAGGQPGSLGAGAAATPGGGTPAAGGGTAGTAGGGAPAAGMGGAAGAPVAGTDGAAGAGNVEQPVGADYYPLEDGAEWAYRHTGGSTPWTEVVTLRAIDQGGQPAFEMRDTPGPSGVRSVQVLVRQNGLTTRVHSEELTNDVTSAVIEYDPGFARFDDAWLAMAPGTSLTLDYRRVERDAAGALVTDEMRSHRYDMLAMGESVTVPAGTFNNCMNVRRQRMNGPGSTPMPGDIETFWFCPDVGKVKEVEDLSGKLEELESCSLPACAP